MVKDLVTVDMPSGDIFEIQGDGVSGNRILTSNTEDKANRADTGLIVINP